MKLEYAKDETGKDILQDETGTHQVMMEWEKQYMIECIKTLDPSGSVLEIGFGMGYSATEICRHTNVTKYTVIECSPVVWEKVELFKQQFPHIEIQLIKGRWQDVLCLCGIFDCAFFDDYMVDNVKENNQRFSKFLYEFLQNHSYIGTKIGLYSTSNTKLEKITCINVITKEYDVAIPSYCKYAHGKKMYMPIITKISECDENLNELLIRQVVFKPLYKTSDSEREKVEKIISIKNKKYSTSCNIVIIDNFYKNPQGTHNFMLEQEFDGSNNHTKSYTSNNIKTIIESHICHYSGPITKWDITQDSINKNGSFAYITSQQRQHIIARKEYKWCGIVFLTPHAPIDSGLGMYMFNGDEVLIDLSIFNNEKIEDTYSFDMSKWKCIDKIGNIFNRLVLFRTNQYHSFEQPFGLSKDDAEYFQTFYFNTKY